MTRTIEAKQDEARENFLRLDETVRDLPDAATRSEFIRRIAGLKAEAAPLLREDYRLQRYASDAVHPDYRGFAPDPRDPAAMAARAEADEKVARLAERFGLDPAASVGRYASETVSLGLGQDYRFQEINERLERRAALGQPDERPEETNNQILAFHAEARAIYRDAAERARDRAGEATRDPAVTERELGASATRRRDDPTEARGGATSIETPSTSREGPAEPPTRPVRSRDEDDGRSR